MNEFFHNVSFSSYVDCDFDKFKLFDESVTFRTEVATGGVL